MTKKYWLMKTEPDTFSIDDLKSRPNKTESWDGVRNYQARNFMRDEMKKGDLILIYHSSCKVPGIAGIAEVAKESHPDHTCFDKKSKYYDPKSSEENPRWFMVSVKFKKKFKNFLPLNELKEQKKLQDMLLLQKGSRLSIQPVTKKEYDFITQELAK
ncbi:EVE domain-containing protein [Halobacteriovorax marinus]|uniref:EVE domain-containing protein n=1 Tax=Halobacteriovorax marinus TaxID=97084 RepID=UPI000BC2DF96|nr:EVE domain-containing protein [Halobacteriovorax marinus]ATH08262.1 EVE domain-containing protein [Halobacteriovorax marinus]